MSNTESNFLTFLKTQFNFSPRKDLLLYLGAFIGVGIVAFYQSFFLSKVDNLFLIGSMGATSTLIYGAFQSPLVQPRNLFGGHLISAFVGISVVKIFPDSIFIAAPLAVATAIFLMQVTRTLHPPGGAIALICAMGSEKVHEMGYLFILPVLLGAFTLFVVALVFNNLNRNMQYPVKCKFITRIRDKMGLNDVASTEVEEKKG